jgi:hypothetical protein
VGELAELQSKQIKELSLSLMMAGPFHFDNSQGYTHQRDQRVGKENQMIVGMDVTWTPSHLSEGSKAYDYDDKLAREAKHKFLTLTVKWLHDLIDQPHLDLISSLAWLKSLINYIPQLHCYKAHLWMCYETHGAKL